VSPEDVVSILVAMRAAKKRERGYADFFGWAENRDLEEQGAVISLAETLELEGKLFFSDIHVRERGNDPPDIEAIDIQGRRVAIEVTELVDGRAIQSWKAGRKYEWAEWQQEKFLTQLSLLLNAKNARFGKLKDGPYPGGYWVVVFTDEPGLPRDQVRLFLDGHIFQGAPNLRGAFLLLSYDPQTERCPCFSLALGESP
jgi:hypothetical protein